jgi:hypothetical protein
MKAYGVHKKDAGCCPGHDKYPPDGYNNDRGDKRQRDQRARKKTAREEGRNSIKISLKLEWI